MFVWGESVGWSSVVNPLLRNPKIGFGNGSQISNNGSWTMANGSRISFNESGVVDDKFGVTEEGINFTMLSTDCFSEGISRQ